MVTYVEREVLYEEGHLFCHFCRVHRCLFILAHAEANVESVGGWEEDRDVAYARRRVEQDGEIQLCNGNRPMRRGHHGCENVNTPLSKKNEHT